MTSKANYWWASHLCKRQQNFTFSSYLQHQSSKVCNCKFLKPWKAASVSKGMRRQTTITEMFQEQSNSLYTRTVPLNGKLFTVILISSFLKTTLANTCETSRFLTMSRINKAHETIMNGSVLLWARHKRNIITQPPPPLLLWTLFSRDAV